MSTTQVSLRIPDATLEEMDRLAEHQPFPPSRTQLLLDALRAFLAAPPYPYEPLPRRKKVKR